jgi:hypothetical protein
MLKQIGFAGVSEQSVDDCLVCGFGAMAERVAEIMIDGPGL